MSCNWSHRTRTLSNTSVAPRDITSMSDLACNKIFRRFTSDDSARQEAATHLSHHGRPSSPVTFALQVSREGFQCIDEYLENHRNVDRHEWITEPNYENDKDYELMTNRVEWAYPTQTREFVALDVIDRPRKILISKSALHPDRPGGSRYQTESDLDETDYVRAVQYYASKVEPLPNGKCLLRMVTWGEMCDSYTAFWINKFNAHVFITPKYERFRRAMSGEKVFELSNIVNEAWKLPKLLMIKPDHAVAKGSNFVDNLRNQGIDAAAAKRAAKRAAKEAEKAEIKEQVEA